MRAVPVQTKRWTRVQYERAIDRGSFHEDERLELLDGLLVVKEPPGDRHAVAAAAYRYLGPPGSCRRL